MLKELEKTSAKRSIEDKEAEHILLRISREDFRRLDDKTWMTTREITIFGPHGSQRVLNAGREFKRGELSFIGLDLATLLDKFHS